MTQTDYHNYSVELFSESLYHFGKLLRAPSDDTTRGQLVLALERTIFALRSQPFRVVTERERKIHDRSLELLSIADQSVNGPDTTEGRAKLYTLVSELKST